MREQVRKCGYGGEGGPSRDIMSIKVEAHMPVYRDLYPKISESANHAHLRRVDLHRQRTNATMPGPRPPHSSVLVPVTQIRIWLAIILDTAELTIDNDGAAPYR